MFCPASQAAQRRSWHVCFGRNGDGTGCEVQAGPHPFGAGIGRLRHTVGRLVRQVRFATPLLLAATTGRGKRKASAIRSG